MKTWHYAVLLVAVGCGSQQKSTNSNAPPSAVKVQAKRDPANEALSDPIAKRLFLAAANSKMAEFTWTVSRSTMRISVGGTKLFSNDNPEEFAAVTEAVKSLTECGLVTMSRTIDDSGAETTIYALTTKGHKMAKDIER